MGIFRRVKEKIVDAVLYSLALWAMYDADGREHKARCEQYDKSFKR
jgi:hypothetical protein